jgi:hypothetical protein
MSMEKQQHVASKQHSSVEAEGQREGGTQQFSPPPFQLVASSGEENSGGENRITQVPAQLQMGISNLMGPPPSSEVVAKKIRQLIVNIQLNEPVDEFDINGMVVRADNSRILAIREAYAQTYHRDLIQDLYAAMNLHPGQFRGGLFTALSWLTNGARDSDGTEPLDAVDRQGGKEDLVAGCDLQYGSNHVRIEGPSGMFGVPGLPAKVIHHDTAGDATGSSSPTAVMERAIVKVPAGEYQDMKINPEGQEQFFTFTPSEPGRYQFQCYIRHKLPDGKSRIQIQYRNFEVKTAGEIATIGLRNPSMGRVGKTALEEYRAQMEHHAWTMEKKHPDPKRAEAFKQYFAQVDSTMEHFLPGTEVPVQAVLTLDEARQGSNAVSGASMPLALYTGKTPDNRFLLADLSPMARVREFHGSSLEEALQDFAERNKYEKGAISLKVNDNPHGYPCISQTLETGGASLLESVSTFTGWTSLGLSMAGLAAATIIPGAQVFVPYLVLGAVATGATFSITSLADHLQEADPSETGITLDILSLVSSIIGGVMAAQAFRTGGKAFQLANGAKYLLYADITVSGTSALVLTADGAEQIQNVLDSKLSRGEKIGKITRILSSLALDSAILALSLKNSIRGAKDAASDADNPALRDGDNPALREADDITLRQVETNTLTHADDALMDIPALRARLGPRMPDPRKFRLDYTDEELQAIVKKGKDNQFSDKAIEDLIFAGSREDVITTKKLPDGTEVEVTEPKRLTSNQLMEQMDYYLVVKARGYPELFRDLDDFHKLPRHFIRRGHATQLPHH